MTDEFYMKQALQLAKRAYEIEEVPIGAIVVWNNKVIAKGWNQVEMLNDCTAHAEMIALTAAFTEIGSKYLMDATLYVTLEPCVMCSGALYWSKIGRIVYAAEDKKNGFSKHFDITKREQDPTQWPFHPKTKIEFGILAEESIALMQAFFQKLR